MSGIVLLITYTKWLDNYMVIFPYQSYYFLLIQTSLVNGINFSERWSSQTFWKVRKLTGSPRASKQFECIAFSQKIGMPADICRVEAVLCDYFASGLVW